MSLTTAIKLQLRATATGTPDLGAAAHEIAKEWSVSTKDGSGAGLANRLWTDQRTLAASASEDLDLAGSLADAFGVTQSFARVKALIIAAAASNANNLVVGAASSNAWAALLGATHTLTIRPGTSVCVFAGGADAIGYVVTAGTGDLLKIANSAGGSTVTYDIAVIGCSA